MDDIVEMEPAASRPGGLVGFALLFCVLATFGFFVLVIASYYGHLWTPLDGFSHLRVHLVGGVAGFAVASLSLLTVQKVRLAVLVLALASCLTVLYAALWPGFNQSEPFQSAPQPNETAFKLISFNVWTSNKTPTKIADYLNSEDADIVVLIEFVPEYKKLLDALKANYPYQYDCNVEAYCHIAVLSKIPFEKAGSKSDWRGPPLIWAQFGEELGGLTLFGVHFIQPFKPNWQWSQMRELARETFSAQGPIVVAGDFNATKESFLVNAFQEFAGLMRITSLPTWPTWFFELPQLGIDHMFISNGLRPLSNPSTGSDAGSDHLPIKAHLAVRTQP